MNADKYMAYMFVINYIIFGLVCIKNCEESLDKYLKNKFCMQTLSKLSFSVAMLVANYYYACLMMAKTH